MIKLKSFIVECSRVLKVTKKPDTQEFKTIVKVSLLGALFLGAVGFVIFMIKGLLV